MRYEGYGPGGVAVIVEALTDNRNRTAGDVRSAFTKSGGNHGRNRRGVLHVRSMSASSNSMPTVASADAMLEAAIDAGADDVVVRRERPRSLRRARMRSREVSKALEAKFGEPR